MDITLSFRCRVCLEQDANTTFHSLADEELRKKFEECSSVVLLPEDMQSQLLCPECHKQCLMSHRFRSRAIDSEKILKILSKDKLNRRVESTRCAAERMTVETEDEVVADLCEEHDEEEFGLSIKSEDPDPLDTTKGGDGGNRDSVRTKGMLRRVKSRGFPCDVCRKVFPKTGALIAHRRIHTGEKPFKCEECEKKFATEQAMKTHQVVHTGERPYQCPDCHKSYSTASNLLRHRRRYHTILKSFKYLHVIKVNDSSAS